MLFHQTTEGSVVTGSPFLDQLLVGKNRIRPFVVPH